MTMPKKGLVDFTVVTTRECEKIAGNGASGIIPPTKAGAQFFEQLIQQDSDTKILSNFSTDIKEGLGQMMARRGMIMMITDQDSADNSEQTPVTLGLLH